MSVRRLRDENLPFLDEVTEHRSIEDASAGAFKEPKPLSPVLIAQPQDLDGLINFLWKMRDELECDDAGLLIGMAYDLVHRTGGVAFIIKAPKIEASLGLRIERTTPLSRHYLLRSVWNLVHPERRDTGYARSLMVTAKDFAERLGHPILFEEVVPSRMSAPRPKKPIEIFGPKIKLCSRHLGLTKVVFTTAETSIV